MLSQVTTPYSVPARPKHPSIQASKQPTSTRSTQAAHCCCPPPIDPSQTARQPDSQTTAQTPDCPAQPNPAARAHPSMFALSLLSRPSPSSRELPLSSSLPSVGVPIVPCAVVGYWTFVLAVLFPAPPHCVYPIHCCPFGDAGSESCICSVSRSSDIVWLIQPPQPEHLTSSIETLTSNQSTRQ